MVWVGRILKPISRKAGPANSPAGVPSAPVWPSWPSPGKGTLLCEGSCLFPHILAREFGASPGSACSGYAVPCQCSNTFVSIQKHKTKHKWGKLRRPQPSPGAGAVNSSGVKSLFGDKCRNSAWDEGFAKPLPGNVCFKGGKFPSPAVSSPLPP